MKISLGILSIFTCIVIVGCEAANVTATKWDSGISGDKAKTRCERLDMRDKASMDAIFVKYDGWKMVYISEYTTGNKLGTDAAVCFERER